jgi:alkanesulfonate monooxygenase SsuD/methylene tetrahydromethanopterin reductase-like flavin-dependent oxidoreductase (luciferase family)
VRYCQGWFGYNMSLEQSKTHIAALAVARAKYDRPAELGDVEITVAPSETVTRDVIDAYREAGVSRLLLRFNQMGTLTEAEELIRANAPAKFGLELART